VCKGNAYVKFELNPVYMVLFARFFLGTVKDRRGGEDVMFTKKKQKQTHTHTHTHIHINIHLYTGTQVHRYTGIQVQGTQVQRYRYRLRYRYTYTYTDAVKNIMFYSSSHVVCMLSLKSTCCDFSHCTHSQLC